MTRAPALPLADRLLSRVEVGERLHLKKSGLTEVLASSRALEAGRRFRGTRAYYLESAVVRHLHVEMSAVPTEASPASRRSA